MITSKIQRQAGRFAGIFLALAVGLSNAGAAGLSPGATINLRLASEPDAAQLLAQTNFNFTSGSFSGTLTSKVWEHDAANPWGGLTFTYRLANASTCADSLGWFVLSGFRDALVDVNYSDTGLAPRTASRSTTGNEISFGFFTRRGEETLLPGDTSAWLVIQTGCNTWGVNDRVGMDTLSVVATTFAPEAVPEPGVAIGLALSAVIGWGRWKQRRA